MKVLKKIMCWNDDYTTSENVLLLFYRVFTYLFPSGLLLWNLVIDKLLNKDISVLQKIGFGGIFLLIIMLIVGVFILGRYFKRTLENLTDKIIECTDDEKKQKLIAKKKQVRKWQETFRNACLVAPFVIALILVNFIEKGALQVRGTLMLIVGSLCAGFGFNITAQNLIEKNK